MSGGVGRLGNRHGRSGDGRDQQWFKPAECEYLLAVCVAKELSF